MPTVKVEADLSADKLLEAAEQLTVPELEKFVAQLLALRARKVAPVLPQEESDLFARINARLPEDSESLLHDLIKKQHETPLTQEEQDELVALIDASENLNAVRVQALVDLASLRHVSVEELMASLGIKTPPVK
jgi:hypothetical protein